MYPSYPHPGLSKRRIHAPGYGSERSRCQGMVANDPHLTPHHGSDRYTPHALVLGNSCSRLQLPVMNTPDHGPERSISRPGTFAVPGADLSQAQEHPRRHRVTLQRPKPLDLTRRRPRPRLSINSNPTKYPHFVSSLHTDLAASATARAAPARRQHMGNRIGIPSAEPVPAVFMEQPPHPTPPSCPLWTLGRGLPSALASQRASEPRKPPST